MNLFSSPPYSSTSSSKSPSLLLLPLSPASVSQSSSPPSLLSTLRDHPFIIILLVHIASDIPLTCVRRSAERKVTTLGKLVYIREMLLVAAFDKLVYYHLLYNISLSSSYLAIFVKRPKMPIVENRTPSHQNSNAFHAYIAISHQSIRSTNVYDMAYYTYIVESYSCFFFI